MALARNWKSASKGQSLRIVTPYISYLLLILFLFPTLSFSGMLENPVLRSQDEVIFATFDGSMWTKSELPEALETFVFGAKIARHRNRCVMRYEIKVGIRDCEYQSVYGHANVTCYVAENPVNADFDIYPFGKIPAFRMIDADGKESLKYHEVGQISIFKDDLTIESFLSLIVGSHPTTPKALYLTSRVVPTGSSVAGFSTTTQWSNSFFVGPRNETRLFVTVKKSNREWSGPIQTTKVVDRFSNPEIGFGTSIGFQGWQFYPRDSGPSTESFVDYERAQNCASSWRFHPSVDDVSQGRDSRVPVWIHQCLRREDGGNLPIPFPDSCTED